MSNKSRSLAYRRDVTEAMERAGFNVVARVADQPGLTAEEKAASDHGDILGTPWTIGTSNATRLDLSKALDDARDGAARAGTDLFAAVHRRRDRPLGESYAVMTLDVFIDVMRRLHLATHDHGR